MVDNLKDLGEPSTSNSTTIDNVINNTSINQIKHFNLLLLSKQTEKLKQPYAEKNYGDNCIRDKNIDQAISHYTQVIFALKELFDENIILSDEEATKYISECGVILLFGYFFSQIPAHLNLSYCYIQIKDWNSVVHYTTKVLELESKNKKAIYRRCKALISLHKVK